MKVSVIMCAYNVSAYIDEAIQSIIAQTWQDWELVISDDGSTDDTVAIIKKYTVDPRVKLFVQPANIGYIRNKNYCFQQASGDLLTQLDADDTYDREKLEKQVNAFFSDTQMSICGSNYRTIDVAGNTLAEKQYESNFWITELSKNYPFWFPGLMFRKELVEEFGLFSEYFSGIYGDDHHWTMRVNQKYPIYFIKEPLYHYRVHPDSLTNFYDENNRKLIAEDIISELYRQHMETGKDQLETGESDKMKAFEQSVFNNKPLMAEKYRMWAAKAIDGKYWDKAKLLLKRSFKLNKTNPTYYKTFAYYLRSKKAKKPS